MSFSTKLINLLKTDPRFVDDEGELVVAAVQDHAWKIDYALVKLLISDAEIKAKFLEEIEAGYWVFNINTFIDYISQKNFLDNSYTRFRNRIGLTIDGKYLRERGNVALVWPYKDTVLEGGQTKEEEKRKEIFFNEVLAQDEINRLLEPKVLTNAKRIDKEGEKPIVQFNRNAQGTITDNLIIKGNNLLTLHSLKKEFAGKVKLIYIDPPYNTGNDGFNYNDSFNKSTWLTFMKNRFDVAKELLSKDGAIFVQCDDNEQAYLKILMDEVFGNENYRETIVVKTSTPSGVNAVNVKRGERLFKVKEYILFYSKTPEYRFKPLYVKSSFNYNYRYNVIKNKDGYSILDLRQKFKDEKEFENYALNNFDNIYSLEKNNKKAGEKIKIEIEKSRNRNEVIEYVNTKGQLVLIYDGGVFIPLKERIISENSQNFFGTLISDLWDDEIFQTNQTEGGVSLPGGKKPEKLIKRILELTTDENDLVLDYHLGTGTTAAVAHKMGRQYIGVEQMDYIETMPVERLKKVIKGEQSGISESINWQGGGDFIYCELMRYNQAYMDRIQSVKSSQELVQIWREMVKDSFLNWYVNPEMPEEATHDFEELAKGENGLEKQKKLLVELLDKNQLYVNLSEIDDAQFKVSKEDKALNKGFYGEAYHA